MLLPARVFRIFVSSTFADLAGEREALRRIAFPRIRDFCVQRGARFQPVDLRWGVSDEAQRAQRTMQVCLDELERCRRVSPRLHLLILLGDRYGWRPLPAYVPVTDFERIRARAHTPDQTRALDTLYAEIDHNAQPEVYCLAARDVVIDAWDRLEHDALAAFRAGTSRPAFGAAEQVTYTGSATEQEIYRGVLDERILADVREHVQVFIREINSAAPELLPRELIDADATGTDTDAQERLRRVKQRLRKVLPPANVYVYSVGLADIDIDAALTASAANRNAVRISPTPAAGVSAFSRRLCDDVYASVTAIIGEELAVTGHSDPHTLEAEVHAAFAVERADPRFFTGRGTERGAIAAYISANSSTVFGLLGPGGSGKSALMARAMLDASERHTAAVVVGRFVGVTPESGNGRSLLEGISAEIARGYGAAVPSAESDFASLTRVFDAQLQLATAERPLVLFLDALDQLSNAHFEHDLRWLPLTAVPSHVRIVVSALAGAEEGCAARLASSLLPDHLLTLAPMPDSDVRVLLDRWLEHAGRRLQPAQRERVVGDLTASGWPLYLRLAFEEARLWRSSTNAGRLGANIAELVARTYARLASAHGGALVGNSLSYLAAARDGMVDQEILDLLSPPGTPVMREFHDRFPRSPATDAFPPVVWSMLYYDLQPYLTERAAHGTPVVSFFHRQLKEGAAAEYLTGEAAQAVHLTLAAYFGAQPHAYGQGETRAYNLRKLSELPYQQRKAAAWMPLRETLSDLSFIEAKSAAGLMSDLLADYDAALQSRDLPAEARMRIAEFGRFVRAHAHLLRGNADLTFQQALNEPDSSSVSATAAAAAATYARPYVALINKPTESSACTMTLPGHRDLVNDCDVSHDGARIVSASADTELKVWDAANGRELVTCRGHRASVESCAFSPDDRYILSAGRDGDVRLWNAATGETLRQFGGHRREVATCRFAAAGTRILTASWDGTVKMWNVATGRDLRTLVHGAQAYTCDATRDGSIVASAGSTGTITLWDAATGTRIRSFEGHSQAVMDCHFSDDGTQLFSASQDGTVKRWNVETGDAVTSYVGHDSPVRNVALAAAAGRLVSAAEDGALIVWDMASGQSLARLDEHLGDVWGVATFPDGESFVSASWDRTLKVWSMAAAVRIGRGWQHTSITDADARNERLWGYMLCCAASGDGRLYAAGSSDGSVRVWTAADGASIGIFAVHADYVFSCTFSPDSRSVLSGCWNGDVTLLDVASGRQTPCPAHVDTVLACGFLSETRLWSCSRDTIRVSDIGNSGVVERIAWRVESAASACAMDAPHSRCVVACESGDVLLFDALTGSRLRTLGVQRQPSCCAVSRDGKLAAMGSIFGDVIVFDLTSGERVAEFHAHDSKVVSCNIAPHGRALVTASWDQTVRIWDLANPGAPMVLSGHTDQCQDACFTSDGSRLLSSAAERDGTVRLWRAADGAFLGSLLARPDSVSACAVAADGALVATASHYHAVKVWDGTTGALEHVLSGHLGAILDCDVSSSGELVSASADATLKTWNAAAGELLRTLAGHSGPVSTCRFLPDGRSIVSGGWDGTVRLWDVGLGRELARYAEHGGWIQAVLASADGSRFASLSHDGTVKVWDVGSVRCIVTIDSDGQLPTAAAWSPDGARLVVGSDRGVVEVWDIAAGRRIAHLQSHPTRITSCAYGERVLSTSTDGTVRLWTPAAPDHSVVLGAHGGPVAAAALSADGRFVASACHDMFARVFSVSTGALLARYWAGAPVTSVRWSRDARRLAVGDDAGKFHLLQLHGAA